MENSDMKYLIFPSSNNSLQILNIVKIKITNASRQQWKKTAQLVAKIKVTAPFNSYEETDTGLRYLKPIFS